MGTLLSPGGGLAEITRTRLNAIIAGLMGAVSVIAYGAKADGASSNPTDNRAAVQAAIDAAAAAGVPVYFPSGTYLIQATSTVAFTYGNTTSNVCRALNINASNLTILGENATIHFKGNTAGVVSYLFATDKNLAAATLTNFVCKGLTLDFNPTGDASTNKRSFYFGGVEGVFLDDLFLTSSGARAGATITFQQCRTARVTRLRAKNVTQGMNLSYVTDVVWDDLQFDNFSEAIDCDRVVDQLVATNLTFRNGGPANQCIDLNSVTNANIAGVTVFNVGNVFIINYKDTTPPTYAEYVNNPTWNVSLAIALGATYINAGNIYICTTAGTTANTGSGPSGTGSGITDGTVVWNYQSTLTLTPSRNVTIEGVKGDTVALTAGAQGCFEVISPLATPLCENITVRNVELTNCQGIALCNLVKNLVLDEVSLSGGVTSSTSFGAITVGMDDITATTQTNSDCSVVMRNVNVIGVTGTGPGIRVNAMPRCTMDGVRVERDGSVASTFFEFSNLDKNASVLVLDRLRVVNTGASAHVNMVPWKFGETGSPTQNYKIVWGRGSSLKGSSPAIPFTLNGSSAKRIEPNRRCSLGSMDVTTGKTHYVQVTMTDTERAFVAYASLSVFLALGASGANYVAWNTRSYLAGVDTAVSSGDDQAGLAAATRMDLGTNTAKASAVLGAGDAYYVKLAAVGSGRTLEGLEILGAVLDYATV